MRLRILYQQYNCNNRRGMTLVEVMIALAIFSTIAIFAVTSTKTGMNIRAKVSDENDYYHTARTLLRHVEKDVSLAFHASSDTKQGQQLRVGQPNQSEYILASFFKGTKNSLLFSASSHRRMYKNTNETDTCEISYTLETDIKDPYKNNFIKRESPFIDENIEEGGSTYVLAEGVNNIVFRYLRPKIGVMESAWVDRWDSTQGDYMYMFPLAVEISFDLISPTNKDKSMHVTQKIKILNPNNIDPAAASITGG